MVTRKSHITLYVGALTIVVLGLSILISILMLA